jgi:Asp-tRNA(Asn)/Glu-tRNA(Gln) amidotransferase A subunit family amidase
MAYVRSALRAPRLAGPSLRLVSKIARSILAPALRWKMLRDLGIDELRAARLELEPLFRPLVPVHAGQKLPLSLPELEPAAAPGFAFESAAQIVAAYRERRTTPVEVAERLLAALAASESNTPPLRALIAQDRADLMRQALESQARHERGALRGPLDGVPVAVKDELDMLPYPTSVGTRFLGKLPAQRDATAVARLRAAGALLFGKTNMHEIGISPTGLNPHHGACRNPYALEHDSGGSSSGVACAVAAGLCPIGLGADGGGSIRIPAAHCGLVGLKPTFGRVSTYGAAPICWSVGHLGPIGATALDCALGYAAIAGPDAHDALSLLQPSPTLEGFQADLRGVRLGVPCGWFEDADAEVVAACQRMIEALVGAGAVRVQIEAPDLPLLQLSHVVSIASEMLATQQRHLRAHGAEYAANTQLVLSLAAGLRSSDYLLAQQVRAHSQREFAQLLSHVDLLLTPTSAVTAPRLRADALLEGESDILLLDALMRFVKPGNFLGLPSISVPAGYDRAGLPIGLMATGRFWEEALLLRLARVAEGLLERRAPVFHRSLLVS